jgi:hypothetical protein
MTETGIFEMSYYRGRSGWYLLLLSIIGLSFIFDIFYKKKYELPYLLLAIIIGYSGLYMLPNFYRTYYPETFDISSKIVKSFPSRTINLITDYDSLKLISPQNRIIPLKEENLSCNYDGEKTFLILEKKTQELDPVLSQNAISSDKNFTEYYKQLEEKKIDDQKKRGQITESKCFSHFAKYWENENIVVFQFKK